MTQLVSHEGATALDRALNWGVKYGVLGADEMERLRRDAPKGIRQIAAFVSTAHLRTELEYGFAIMQGLVNLALDSLAPGDPQKAAKLLRDLGILALSKEGNTRIKALRALPDDTLFEASPEAPAEKAFLEEWAMKSFSDYQKEKARREQNHLQMQAARWLVGRADGRIDTIMGYHAELAGRTALLALAAKVPWPGGTAGFEQMLGKLAARKTISLPGETPEEFIPVLKVWAQECSTKVLLVLKQTERRHELSRTHPDNELTAWLLIPDPDLHDLEHCEASTSERWRGMTDGRKDEATLLAVLLTAALEETPRPCLSAAQFDTVVAALRSGALDSGRVDAFVANEVPHPYQEALHELWQSFRDEAESWLGEGGASLKRWLEGEVRLEPAKRKRKPGS